MTEQLTTLIAVSLASAFTRGGQAWILEDLAPGVRLFKITTDTFAIRRGVIFTTPSYQR